MLCLLDTLIRKYHAFDYENKKWSATMVILFCGENWRGLLFRWANWDEGSFFCSSPVTGSSPEFRSHFDRILRLSGPHRRWGPVFGVDLRRRAFAGGPALAKPKLLVSATLILNWMLEKSFLSIRSKIHLKSKMQSIKKSKIANWRVILITDRIYNILLLISKKSFLF